VRAPAAVDSPAAAAIYGVGGAAHPRGVLTALASAVSVGAAVSAPIIGRHGDHPTADVVRAILVLVWLVAGLSTASARPAEPQGRRILGWALVGSLGALASAVTRVHGSQLPRPSLAIAQLAVAVAAATLPFAAMHLMLGLPDGSCRLSRTAIAAGYATGIVVGLALWTQRPHVPLWPVGLETVLALTIGATGSNRRFRRSRGAERQRMEWFGCAAVMGAELAVVALALRLLTGWPEHLWATAPLATLPVPIALALAASGLSGRVDRLLAHTISVAGLSGVVVGVYLVIVVGLGRTPAASERSLLALSMFAAAVAALLYGPARLRLAEFANRLVYGSREAPDAVLRTFSSRLSRAIPMDELLLQAAESLRRTLNLSTAEVWTGTGGRLERTISVPDAPTAKIVLSQAEGSVVARAGVSGPAWVGTWLPALMQDRPGSMVRVAPTTHAGEVMGLIVAVRPGDADPFTDDDDTMLTELARQVGLALHNVELDSALQASLDEVRQTAEELQASRARIVAASDAARRQIERDLHDGAQQHLVALAVNVRLARKLAESDPEASLEVLDQLAGDLQNAVQELRALAHGIYPPLLVDRGLGEALRSAAGRAALATLVEAEAVGRHDAEIEAAVYFCCLEALQNAAKHAGEGATATVRVEESDGGLLFEVRDDGAGFDTASRGLGAGFVNMNDRVGAIGGTVSVESAPGRGTCISGRIPLRS